MQHIAELPQRWARETPAATALIEGAARWSYAMLDVAALAVARRLEAAGVQRGDRVLIVGENAFAQVAALFGASRLGAWPALVNARCSAREIDVIRDHAQPRVVLYTTGNSVEAREHAVRHGVPLGGAECVLRCTDEGAGVPSVHLTIGATNPRAVAESGADAAAVAALIYTSGTTGAPKGVMVTHEGLLSFAERSVAVRRMTSHDVVLGALPMSHIFGIATILLTTLNAGAAVVLQSRFDATRTLDALQRGELSILHGVPTLYARLLGALEERGLRGPFPALRYVYVGGGALDPALKRRIESALGLPAHHGYGMTEYAGSMFVTHIDRPRDDALPGEIAPDCEARFVGEDERDVRCGETGEIWIRGPGTMRGYYRDPALTRAALTREGWLRTGDLGWLDAGGALHIVGRARDIIKRSGFTVHPLEIEQQLLEHPAVRLAGVVGVPDVDGEERIIAFVETHAGASVDIAELLGFARERLSGYKCPQHIVQIEAMPLTANGKVRKQMLREFWASCA